MRTEPPKLRTAYDTIDSGTEALLTSMTPSHRIGRAVATFINLISVLLFLASPALLWALFHWAFTQ